MTRKLLYVFVKLSWLVVTHSLIAYDCQNWKSNITVISMRDVAPCPTELLSYKEELKNVHIVQRNEYKLQKVQTCLVNVHRVIHYCGKYSHASVVAGGLSNHLVTLGERKCREMHTQKFITYGNSNHEIRVIMNGTTRVSITEAGTVDQKGNCKGVTHSENGQTWTGVVVQSSITITAREYLATVKLNENEIMLSGGLTCNFLKEYCIDSTLGETVWSVGSHIACENGLSSLYKGKATIVNFDGVSKNNQILVVEQQETILAVSLLKAITVCSFNGWQTEHPRIMVIIGEDWNNITPNMPLLPQNTNLTMYTNSRFLYTEQAYKKSVDNLYKDTIYRRCLTNREILKNRLLMAPLSQNALSSIINNKMGYVSRVLGEVLYIMECTPVLAELRETNFCYNELPITVNNQPKFMVPITHLVVDYGLQVDCETIAPQYFIDGKWIALTPHPMLKYSPIELQVGEKQKLEFSPIQPLGSNGQTEDEIKRIQKLISFGLQRDAVSNLLTRKLAGLETDDQGFNTINLFDKKEHTNLARNNTQLVLGWFTDIGIWFSGFIGFYFILRTIKYVVDVMLNGLAIYKTFGCGLTIIASFWDKLSIWLIYRHHQRTHRRKDFECA